MNDDEVTTVVRVGDPGQIVSGLPAFFGFTPRESLVVLSLHGDRDRIGFRLRHDLVTAEEATDLAEQLVEMLLRNQVSTVLVVGCSADVARCDHNVRALCEVLHRVGIRLQEALRCDGERWWSYTCQQRCCPTDGTPYDPLDSLLVAEAIGSGMPIVPDRADLARRVVAVSGSRAVAMQAATDRSVGDITARLDQGAVARTGRFDRRLVEHAVLVVRAAVDRALSGVPVSDDDAADLSTWCSLIPVRDIAWAQVTRVNASEHFEVWSQVARKVVPPWEPAVLSLAGFCAWLSGDGALAWCALDRVEQADPDYSMADLIRHTLRHGLSPDTWIPVPEELIWDSLEG